jgi:uncharacterized membrane protein YkvA (DUF1232 family)
MEPQQAHTEPALAGAPSSAPAAPEGKVHKLFRVVLREGAERVAERFSARQIPKLLDRRDRVKRELRSIPDRMQKLTNQAALVLELLDDYRDGTYRAIPWRSLAVAAGALLYSVSPSDVVPDFVPVLGQLDDALVIGVAMYLIRRDLKLYVRFKGYPLEKYFD